MTARYPTPGVPGVSGVEGPPIVAIASSAGGIPALTTVLTSLPPDLRAPVLVVQHLHPDTRSHLAAVLQRASALPVVPAEDGQEAVPGRVYVAPPGHHLILDERGWLQLHEQPPVRFLRPCADVLFRSLAERCGHNALAVILSGTGADGAAGAVAVRAAGGDVLIQDPAGAEFSGMPAAALEAGSPAEVVALDAIGERVVEWVEGHVAEPVAP
jgi:two-component system chemotaxis response regulator CheB